MFYLGESEQSEHDIFVPSEDVHGENEEEETLTVSPDQLLGAENTSANELLSLLVKKGAATNMGAAG